MKTKQQIIGLALVVVLLMVVSIIGISSRNKIAGLVAETSILNVPVQPELTTRENNKNVFPGFIPVDLISEENSELTNFNNDYVSFRYPTDWLLGTYRSNGYPALGIYDPISQEQKTEGDLRQGAKIQISICDCAPENDFKNTLLQRISKGPEKITKIFEENFDFYKDQNEVDTVVTNFETEYGGGQSFRFVGRDGLLYTLSLGIPDFRKLNDENIQEYQLVFEDFIQSFTLSK